MDSIPYLWRNLVETFSQDAASPRVEELTADLAARVGAAGYEPCLGLFRPESVARYYGVTYLLAGYGLTLRLKGREDGKGVFVYLSPEQPEPSEFQGAMVTVRRSAAALRSVA